MMFLEVGDLSGLVFILCLIMFGPPVAFSIVGFGMRKKNKKISKIFYILAVLYLIIGLGICGSILAG